jgi:Na+-transporting NADH:ubiquinone oxidoreductase subunit E
MYLFGLFIQSIFIENFLLSNFLGMCTYLACSTKFKTANGLGLAVVFVMTVSGVLNWSVHHFITGPEALSFLGVDLSFLEFLLFICVIAAFTQVVEIIIDNKFLSLYRSLGLYLPLIAVNCAILGASLFAATRDLPFLPNLVYVFGSSLGWWLAICLMAAIREKLSYSNPPQGLEGMGITFIMTGIISLGFMGFTGMNLAKPTKRSEQAKVVEKETKAEKKNI